MPTAIIIDDIESARRTLKKDLATWCPEVQVIGEAGGVMEAAKLLKTTVPDVVFLDVAMQDGSGFDLLDMLTEIRFHIIFTTASDAHAVRAFRFSAVDYLLKPIDPDELKAAVNKLQKTIIDRTQSLSLLKSSMEKTNKKQKKLALHSLDKIHVVNISDILRCESNINYTEFFFTTGKKMLVTRTLKEFEELLAPHGFFRVHNSHLVNTKHIREFIKTDGGYLIMNDGTNVPVSSRRRAEVIRMLESI